ncbi:MAG: NAD(P)/FAD-dependent oxidoreductase [Pseudomonadota bacterium]
MSGQDRAIGLDSEAEAGFHDVIIVGAGFAGLFLLYRLRALGLKVQVYEAGSGVGGTWFWNRYPGARCDVESMEYSYSFSSELEQEWQWTERYAAQPEILHYINHVADRFALRDEVQLNTRVLSAGFDPATRRWTVTTDRGDTVQAQFCIMATGSLSASKVPDFKGLSSFKGNWYHTGLWPSDGVDFSGMRVGVVGTGSSGIQAIPKIAEQAAHLTVFQRTAHFSVPALNGPLAPEQEQWFKAHYAERRKMARESPTGVAGFPVPTRSALEVTPEERESAYQHYWDTGGTGFTRAFNDLIVNKDANETAAEFARKNIRKKIHDPVIAELLVPKGHFIGTKRICLDIGYYETFNRDNVTLVDVKSAPITEITETGIRTENAEYELDAIVFATGFDAVTGALSKIDIHIKDGATLAGKWAAGPRMYLGLMTAGFPNLFIINGPGSPSVLSNMMTSLEQHVEWIANCLDFLRSHGMTRIEADLEAENQWVHHVNEVADRTLFPLANSWYIGANIPGKPRVFMPYVGGVGVYRQKCLEVAEADYAGFHMTS